MFTNRLGPIKTSRSAMPGQPAPNQLKSSTIPDLILILGIPIVIAVSITAGFLGLLYASSKADFEQREFSAKRAISDPMDGMPFFDMQVAGSDVSLTSTSPKITPRYMAMGYRVLEDDGVDYLRPAGPYFAANGADNQFVGQQLSLGEYRVGTSYQVDFGSVPQVQKSLSVYPAFTAAFRYSWVTFTARGRLTEGLVSMLLPVEYRQTDSCFKAETDLLRCSNLSGNYTVTRQVIGETTLLSVGQEGQAPLYLF